MRGATGCEHFRAAPQHDRTGRSPLLPDRRERELVRTGAGDDHEVNPVGNKARPQSEALATHSLDAIPHRCIADLFGRNDPEARRRRPCTHLGVSSPSGNEHHEVMARRALADGLHMQEIGASPDATLTTEGERLQRALSTIAGRLYFL